MTVEFRDLTRVIGSEVIGADMTQPLSQDDFQAIRDRWLERTILLFRGQETAAPDDQIRWTRRFGELELHTLPQFTLPSHPEVFVVSNILEDGKPIGALRAGAHWHSDSQFLPVPSSGSLLLAREVPEEGGDTLFANLCAAYDDLPRKTKERIDGLKILVSRVKAWPISYPHRPPLSAEQKAKLPDIVHPLVRRHPDTGRKVLYIGGNVVWEIVGMGFEEGRRLLDELRAHATQPEYVYRHRWRVGDAILWDNRCTLHCATDYDEQRYRRLMHRTTLVGTAPV
jgi:alpha-ketoglutarate-dependent taurine dioxygenase